MRSLLVWSAVLLLSSGLFVAASEDVAPGLTLIVPDGPFRPGDTIHVTVVPEAGSGVESVFVMGPPGTGSDDESPFEFDIVVPRNAYGEIPLAAFGKGPNVMTASEPVKVEIVPDFRFERIRLGQDDAFFVRAGDSEMIIAVGVLPEGDEVKLWRYKNENRESFLKHVPVEFVSSDPSVVTVDEFGFATATGDGKAKIVVKSGELRAEVAVTVSTNNQKPVVEVGPRDRCVVPGSWVVLEGFATDPDNGPHPLEIKGWSFKPLEHDFGVEHKDRLRIGLVAPDLAVFHAFLYVHDGEDSVYDFVSVHVDQDLDSVCQVNKPGQGKFPLDAEPWVPIPR